MPSRRVLGIVVATAVFSVAGTLLIRDILSEEPIAEGALPASYHSTILGEDREFYVHLPQGYEQDAATRYPVIYVLDGTSQSEHTAASAALLARIGVMPSVIVIGVPSVDGDTRNRDYTPPDMRLDTDKTGGPHGEADRFLESLETELVPLVEQTYRTMRPRVLAGWSRGGLFAVYAALTAPGLFDAHLANSPALWREDDRIVHQVEAGLRADTLAPTLLYLSLGDGENPKMTASFTHMREVLARDAGPGIRWRADLSAGGTHQSNPRLSTPVGLCAIFAGPTGHKCRPSRELVPTH